MAEDTWKSSYAFDFRQAASIMDQSLKELGYQAARSTEEDAEYFDVDGGSFTIKLYHNKFRMRTGFGFPGWLKPSDISDIIISPVDQSKELRIKALLKVFVEKSPVKPWDFGMKVKAYSMGIGGRTRKAWERWVGD
jgi:hypothetical protein